MLIRYVSAPLLEFSLRWCRKLFINFFGRSVSSCGVFTFLWYRGCTSVILELTFWPTIDITFLGFGSIKLLSCDFLDYYETSVVFEERFTERFVVDSWAKSALVRQKPTIYSWGSISTCIWTLFRSLWMYWTYNCRVGLFVWIYHNKQSFSTELCNFLLVPGYFLSSMNKLRKLTELTCFSMVFEWKSIYIKNSLLFLEGAWYPWFGRI